MVGVEGEPLGIVSLQEAMQQAETADLDLVEIAPMADPPVCRIMDFGKFRYQEQKKAHEAKLKQKQIQVKEIKFRPNTDDGDYNIKMRNLLKFIEEGDKAKITLRFRGREMAHQEFGQRLLERVRTDTEAHAVVEQYPKMEGRQLIMVLAPKKKDIPVPVKKKPEGTPGVKPEGAKREPRPAKPDAAAPAVAAAEAAAPAVAAAEAPKADAAPGDVKPEGQPAA
ncbi:MAG: translation initiation factor [Betaproteobacteria bacterium]|nr:translation initiation factor [Betaproteobacteria bacterium]